MSENINVSRAKVRSIAKKPEVDIFKHIDTLLQKLIFRGVTPDLPP